MEKNIKV